MEYVYAELNGSGRVKALLRTPDGEIASPTMISVPAYDESLLGKLHVGGGVFEEAE
jgi:hypothetical protein